MVGAIIGAAVSAGSAILNYLETKKQNEKMRQNVLAEKAASRAQETVDRYGDWRYSGANLYFNKAADEVKDYVRQQRAARRVTGAQGTGAEEAAGKAIAQAAGQATAQRQAVGMHMAQEERKRQQELSDKLLGIDRAQSAATTQAWTQVAQAAGGLATSLDGKVGGSGGGSDKSNTSEVTNNIKMGEAIDDIKKANTPATQAGYKNNSVINFDGMSQAEAEKIRNQMRGL